MTDVWPFHRHHRPGPVQPVSLDELSAAINDLPRAIANPARGLLSAARDLIAAADYLNQKHGPTPGNHPMPPDGAR